MYLVNPQTNRKLRTLAAFTNWVAPSVRQQYFLLAEMSVVFGLDMSAMATGLDNSLTELIAVVAVAILVGCTVVFGILNRSHIMYAPDSTLLQLYREWGQAIRRLPAARQDDANLQRFTEIRRLHLRGYGNTDLAECRKNFPTI